jgi:hypothetical protein
MIEIALSFKEFLATPPLSPATSGTRIISRHNPATKLLY